MLLYFEKASGSRCESGIRLSLTFTERHVLLTWEPFSDRFLTVRFQSSLKRITIVKCYAPTETDIVEKEGNYMPLRGGFNKSTLSLGYGPSPNGFVFIKRYK